MKLSDFIVLDDVQKKDVLLHQGVLVAKRNSTDCMFFLFQMENYYVESEFYKENKTIKEFRAFMNPKSLVPYLDMPLDDLMN